MRQFSVITPSYNRANFLQRVYDSLCLQKGIDFEWIIVDDGSSDNTKEAVSGFKKAFEIKYIYQENAGKPTAMNTGLQAADSYISVSLDSDDILCAGVLKTVWNYFDVKTGKFEHGCACVSGLCQYDNGEIIGDKFPKDYYVSDHINCRHNKKVKGDKLEFVLTSVLREYPFPVFENEKNISPGILMIRIALSYKTLYVNCVFAEKQFLPGGLSTQNYWFMYPHGAELYYNEASVPPFKLTLQIRHSGRYIFFAKMNRQKHIFLRAMNKPVFPLGLCSCFFYNGKMFFKKIPAFQKINSFKKSIVRLFKKNKNYKVFKPE